MIRESKCFRDRGRPKSILETGQPNLPRSSRARKQNQSMNQSNISQEHPTSETRFDISTTHSPPPAPRRHRALLPPHARQHVAMHNARANRVSDKNKGDQETNGEAEEGG